MTWLWLAAGGGLIGLLGSVVMVAGVRDLGFVVVCLGGIAALIGIARMPLPGDDEE